MKTVRSLISSSRKMRERLAYIDDHRITDVT